MSRLERHYRKEMRRRIIFFSGLFVVVIIFFFTTGLGFIIDSSSFVAGLFGNRKGDDRGNILLQDITIDELPQATKNSQITVSGSAVNFDRIELYLNDKKVTEVNLSDSGEFQEDLDGLNKGQNEIYIIAKKGNDQRRSDTHTITYLAEKPTLEITEPADGSTTSNQEIKVAGKTGKEIEVKINDLPIVVDSQGAFQTVVKLQEGENKIKVSAIDIAGNTEEKTLTVKYEKD